MKTTAFDAIIQNNNKAMIEHEINTTIIPDIPDYINEQWVNDIVNAILKELDLSNKVELGLVITDNETVRQLNREYRNLDEYTDVLAFHMPHYSENSKVDFITPPDNVNHLGDIIISYPQAVKQAAEQGHQTIDELVILIIHGILHLLGYDHELPEEEILMHHKAEMIRRKLEIQDEDKR